MSETDMASRPRMPWNRSTGFIPASAPGGHGTPEPHGTPAKKDCGCGACPTCTGLVSFTRPRFFAGQLLTDAELNELQRYVIDKDKLHNRFLHGWGVVCGLEVACGDCGDDIVIRAGYALDPCGNDVVVPSPQRFDVNAAIQRCLTAERARPDCDPPYDNPPSRCDEEATWCVTVRYVEQDVRPVTPLTPAPARSCSCGGASCGCGAGTKGRSGYECTCGAGGSRSTTTCGCTPPKARTPAAPGCEPTRTIECYELGVCRDDGNCKDLRKRLEGTMPLRIMECLLAVLGLFGDNVSAANQKVVGRMALDVAKKSDANKAGDALTQFYAAVAKLYERDPLRTRCAYPSDLRAFEVPRQGELSDSTYLAEAGAGTQMLMTLVLDYMRECICDALLPPCPPDPCDDRIVLACLTMKDGKVVEICNHACRRYAGSFVSREYWLPVVPTLSWLAGMLCCAPLTRLGGRRGLDVARTMDSIDPNQSARAALAENDFAAVSGVRSKARAAVRRLRPSQRGSVVERWIGERVNLAAHYGKQPANVEKALAKDQVEATVVRVDDPDDVPVRGVGLLPLVRRGAKVVAYVHENRVIAFGPAVEAGGTAGDG